MNRKRTEKILRSLSFFVFYLSLGNFLRNTSVIGRETSADKKYAKGWAISMPLISKNLGRIMHRGINIAPLCKQDRSSARIFFPMLWNITVPTIDMGKNIRNMQYIRSASLPIWITSASGRKSDIICGARAKQIAAIEPRIIIPKPNVKYAPFFTLEYFLAP